MKKLTRRGICYELEHSNYTYKVKYQNTHYTYYFSSINNKTKFINKLKENREHINDSLSHRFKIRVRNDLLADIVLYKKVESRGFYITGDNDKWQRISTMQLDGVMKIVESYQE